MPTFDSFDGREIAYTDQGEGPLAVLLHGFASDGRGNWGGPGVVDALVAAGHRVVVPDARGHGASAKPHDPAAYDDDAMVRDVVALLDHLGAAEADVAGYSMGSFVTSRLLDVEPRVRRAVLGGVGVHMASSAATDGMAGIADALEADDPSTITDPTARGFRAFADASGADRLALAAVQRAPRRHGVPDLGSVAIPVLVLTGDRDTLVGSPQELADRIPGGRCQILAGDHLSAVGDPAFAAAVVGFFAGPSPAA